MPEEKKGRDVLQSGLIRAAYAVSKGALGSKSGAHT
jgi:hypothetical protein